MVQDASAYYLDPPAGYNPTYWNISLIDAANNNSDTYPWLNQALVTSSLTRGEARRLYRRIDNGNPAVTNADLDITTASGVRIGIAQSGTMGANGAVTLGTALNSAHAGIWLYFAAGAVYAGSVAGFYWVVMSTTTAGVVYNNIYTVVADTIPRRTASPTPIVAAGPGAFVGDIVEQTVFTKTIKGGSLGKNGRITIENIAGPCHERLWASPTGPE